MSTDATAGPEPANGSMVVGRTPEVLGRVVATGCGLAVWQRQVPEPLATWARTARFQTLPRVRATVPADATAADIGRHLDAQTPPCPGMFLEDVADLVRRFAVVAGTPRVDCRITPVDDNACTRFHMDNVAVRLVVTYRGPGTVLVPGCHAAEALSVQDDYAGPTLSVPRFAVAVFRGAQDRAGGVVHRSPRILGSGRDRLIVVLNPRPAA